MSPRILFCSQAAHFGGTEVWLEDLAGALRDQGWEVVIALARGRFHDPAIYLQRHPHPDVQEIDGTLGFREQRFLSLMTLFDRVRPDVIMPVHLADALYAASEWKRRGGNARLVTCLHTVGDDGILGDLLTCQSFLDLVTSVSRRMTERLREALRLDPNQILHIPTGVPPPLAEPRVRERVQHLGLISRLDHAEKRVLDLIPLAQRLESEALTFHIVGNGPDEPELRARLATDVHRGAFFFHGALRRPDLYERIYPRLDALLILSEREAGPIVAWEAMIHGVVPIASDFEGREEEAVIRDHQTARVFPVGDTETAAKIIRELCQPSALSALSRKCREALPKSYHQPEFSRRWNEELRRVLTLEPRTDVAATLPRPVSPGLIARLRLGPEGTLRLRKLFRRRGHPQEPGAEWPHRYGKAANSRE